MFNFGGQGVFSRRYIQLAILQATKYLFSALEQLYSFEKSMHYIEVMFDKTTYDRIFDLFNEPDLVFINQYPSFKKYIESDSATNESDTYFSLMEKLKEYQVKNPIDQRNIGQVFI